MPSPVTRAWLQLWRHYAKVYSPMEPGKPAPRASPEHTKLTPACFTPTGRLRGIVGLGRKFRILNDDGNSSLNMYEFTKGLRETGLECPESDMRGLFKAFDTDNSGSISFDEFLVAIRGQLNARRK